MLFADVKPWEGVVGGRVHEFILVVDVEGVAGGCESCSSTLFSTFIIFSSTSFTLTTSQPGSTSS